MKYQICQNKILIEKTDDFNIFDICHCGQLFRYFEKESCTSIISTNQIADIVHKSSGEILIECTDANYFAEYFDLDTDYSKIKESLSNNVLMKDAINFGKGIRILRQNFFETFLSFIVSQNNNIKRIQNSLNALSRDFGEKIGNSYAFPTLQSLENVDEKYFESIGTGYRAKYLVNFIATFTSSLESELRQMPSDQARSRLISFLGVGEKVADCILLFGLNRKDVFPVDTWIDKVACEYFGMKGSTRQVMSRKLVEKFGELAGFAQQYLFYYKRELSKKGE